MGKWQDNGFDWAVEFDENLRELIEKEDYKSLIDYKSLKNWELAIPTNDHYLPLLYALALKEKGAKIQFFNEKVTMGAISMRSLMIR